MSYADWVKIDGKSYDVKIMSISRSYNVLYNDNNTGRTLGRGAPLTLDPLGTFISYKITFKREHGKEKALDELWDKLTQPTAVGVKLEVVYNQKTINFRAYVASGEQNLKEIDEDKNIVYWDVLDVKFIPMKAQVLP